MSSKRQVPKFLFAIWQGPCNNNCQKIEYVDDRGKTRYRNHHEHEVHQLRFSLPVTFTEFFVKLRRAIPGLTGLQWQLGSGEVGYCPEASGIAPNENRPIVTDEELAIVIARLKYFTAPGIEGIPRMWPHGAAGARGRRRINLRTDVNVADSIVSEGKDQMEYEQFCEERNLIPVPKRIRPTQIFSPIRLDKLAADAVAVVDFTNPIASKLPSYIRELYNL